MVYVPPTLPAIGENSDLQNSFETSERGNTAQKVYIQDQTTDSLDVPFLKTKFQTTLEVIATVGSRFITVPTGIGTSFTANITNADGVGDIVELANGETFMQARVIGIVDDVIELEDQVNHAYVADTVVLVSSDNLLIDGSITPQIFSILPLPTQSGDLTRIILRMEATADQDSGTFGPLDALRVGVQVRKKRSNGDFKNIINFKTNGEFVAKCFDNNFLPNNGNNVRLFVARLTWAGVSKHGVVQRLEGELGEELQVVISDNLTGASFIRFTLAVQGHELQETL